MASSGYTAITFVANEQPTTAKWNLIGSNDSSFNLGTGFEDGVIVTRHHATNGVPGNALATNALLLGYVDTATTQSGIGASEVDLTGLSITVTVPAGGRSVKISVGTWLSSTVSGDTTRVFVKEGSTYLGFHTLAHPNVFGHNAFWSVLVIAPSAGTHTYKLTAYRQSGSGSIASNAGAISASNTKPFIMAELV